MADISSQLADIFKAGLDSNPDLAKSLASAIHDDLGTGGKSTKAEANYRQADGADSCSKCQHFDGTSGCELVSGNISPNGVSDLYESASKSDSPAGTTDVGPKQDKSSGESAGEQSSDTGPESVSEDKTE